MGGSQLLPELAESDSDGEVAALYAEIRATLGIPFVGLIYRTLAVEPGRLGRVWSRLGPFLGHSSTWAVAAALDPGLDRAPAIAPAKGLRSEGFDTRLAAQSAATLAAYDRMNRLNLLGLSALVNPDRPSSAAATTTAPPRAAVKWVREDLLPMATLDTLPAADRDVLLRISESLLAGQRPVLVPSLLRHFARPGVLPILWKSVGPAVECGFLAAAAARLRLQAASLPFPPGVTMEPILDAEVIEIAKRFVIATSTMIVAGALLDRALEADRG